MDVLINGYNDEALPLAREALQTLAAEMPLEDILLELRRYYRAAWDDPFTRENPDYRQVCDAALRALDAALWRLETDER